MPSKLWGLHHCDNPPCCNPWHIFPGTHQDNVNDRQRKGRSAKGARNGLRIHPEQVARGERNANARLTAEDVLTLRSLAQSGAYTQTELAQRYSVVWTTIAMAVDGRTWAHLPGACIPKWRQVKAKGGRNAKAKLTADDVKRIRQRANSGDWTNAALADAYNVGRTAISYIVRRKTWQHIAEAEAAD
jgi:hypothetical protein